MFHHDQFEGNQREVVQSFLNDQDTLAIIPTGGGKTMCYWITGIVTKGVTVVITPLLVLLNDQVSKLRNYGIPVCYVTSSTVNRNRMVGLAGKLQRQWQIMLRIKEEKCHVRGKRYAACVFI